MVKNFAGLVKQEFTSYWQNTLHHSQKLEFFLSFRYNKNALSSVESRLLGDKFCCQRRRCCYTTFSFGIYKTSVICHNVNTQKVKIARRDRPHILASNRCETFENHLHIDIVPVRSAPSGILHSKKLNDDFYRYQGPMTSVSINIHSFFVPDQDTARYSICSEQEKCVSLTEPYTTHS